MNRPLHLTRLFSLLLSTTLLWPVPGDTGESVEMRVTASVISNCKIQSVSDISFGQLDPGQAVNLQASGVVALSCTRGVDFALSADHGQHSDANGSRRMKSSANEYLPYTLNSDYHAGVGQGFSRPINVSFTAQINGNDYRDIAADNYSDVIRINLEP